MRINIQQELKFIHSEKIKISNKDGLPFEVLNIAQTLISNCINTKPVTMKMFYKILYWKTKNFYLEQYK